MLHQAGNEGDQTDSSRAEVLAATPAWLPQASTPTPSLAQCPQPASPRSHQSSNLPAGIAA